MNKNLTSNEIRRAFLDFFKSKGHMIEPGASLIPINDPTLLWINSGVAALKKYFDGSVKPYNNRIVNAQKCIRTNDIENVGKTSRHQTFFEMLGNFSIGDYFKEEAIEFAWEFLTNKKWMSLDKDRLYISIHTDDNEAFDIWVNKIGVDPKKILKTGDNFWQIGDGPCGPNTEIHYDRGDKYDPENIGEKLFFDEMENDRYIEVWNVVFSQYDGKEGVDRSTYAELPQKNIDTGMGFERLVSIIQDVETNYDTDVFIPIIQEVEKYTTSKYHDNQEAFRVIADHVRTSIFALADGAIFANEGRGYVLRRLLRRAVRYGIKLQINEPFLNKLVPVVINTMKDFYSYLPDKSEFIIKQILAEEVRFHSTLHDGENLLLDLISKAKVKKLEGIDVFKLYDTYGFPLELTQEIASEHGFRVDETGFNIEMEKQRNRARDSRENFESMNSQSQDLLEFTAMSEFIGYDTFSTIVKMIGLFKDGHKVTEVSDHGQLIFDKTVFYAESGGQIADIGIIKNDAFEARVTNVNKAPNGQSLLSFTIIKGTIKVNDSLLQNVDMKIRMLITKHHSAIHLLQSALKSVVGNHINQAGSYVSSEYARFDFTHYEKLSDQQLKEIEKLVNEYIALSHDVVIESLDINEAKAKGAIALFNEKYSDVVRVVSMQNVSIELCGGCHVNNTSEIGIFKILNEESVGSGIRRITICVSLVAYQEYLAQENLLNDLSTAIKAANNKAIKEKLYSLLTDIDNLKKENSDLTNKLVNLEANSIYQEAVDNDLFKVLIYQANNDIKNLKDFAEEINNKVQGVVFLYQVVKDKIILACSCSEKAIAHNYHAGNLVKEAANICDGNGGGKDSIAQAGGKNPKKVKEMCDFLEKVLNINN
ncbi:MAG: alanine--tRNA ligase [Erysipelotrichaceae bacterium]